MEQNEYPALPLELMVAEVARRHSSAQTRYVLGKVNRFLNVSLRNERTSENHVEVWASLGYLNLIRWDQEGPKPSKITVIATRNATRGNYIDILRYFERRNRHCFDTECTVIAVKNQQKEILNFFRKCKVRLIEDTAMTAVKAGDLDMLEYLSELGTVFTSKILSAAAETKDMKTIEFLLSKNVQFDKRFVEAAAATGDLDFVKWAVEKGAPLPRRAWKVHENAATAGSLEIMKFAYEDHKVQFSMSTNVVQEAIKSGNLQLLEYLVSVCRKTRKHLLSDFSSTAWYHAMSNDFWLVVEFGLANGMELIPKYYANAVADGKQNVLTFLDQRGGRIDYTALISGLKKGDFALVEELRRRNVAWSSEVTNELAKHGNIDTFKWALARGCPLAETALASAVNCNHMALAKYLHELLRCPLNVEVLKAAVNNLNFPMLSYLAEKRCRADERIWAHLITLNYFTRDRSKTAQILSMLDILLSMGFQPRTNMISDLAQHFHFAIMRWLQQNGAVVDENRIRTTMEANQWKFYMPEVKADYTNIRNWLDQLARNQ